MTTNSENSDSHTMTTNSETRTLAQMNKRVNTSVYTFNKDAKVKVFPLLVPQG